MPDDDAELEVVYRSMSTEHLKRAGVAFALDRVDAHRSGPECEAFCDRRIAIIRRLLDERGERFSLEGGLF